MNFDMVLVHAPSVYDFRERDDILFAYLGNSDGVHVSPIFEMPPVGVYAIKQHLERCGFAVEFFNVASQMLRYPDFDVETFLRSAAADYVGVDLHWLVSAHGALELLGMYKGIYPGSKTVIGGLSATYYHHELIRYPQVDYVVRGYDTLLPIELLLRAENSGHALSQVPNLTWKQGGEIRINEMTHTPSAYTAMVDWTKVFSGERARMTPYNLVIPQAGCEYDCRFCGGSRRFFDRHMGIKQRVQKTPEMLQTELESIVDSETSEHTVTMIDFWHEYPKLFDVAMDVLDSGKIRCVHYSLNRLPPLEQARRMGSRARAILELSPDSHDIEVAKACGRGKYTMQEMEEFIDALVDDIYAFEIYFMIGLPQQSVASVWETVDYCEHLLSKYRGKRVTPFICPMLPFLDPGSELYDRAKEWGYTIFHHSLDDHREALLSMSWKDRLNYETRWLSRDDLVEVSYDSVRALTLLKHRYGLLPRGITNDIVALIDETRLLMKDIDAYQAMPGGESKDKVERDLRRRILGYNRRQFQTVRSQQRPIDFGFAEQQWFDTDVAFGKVMGGKASQ